MFPELLKTFKPAFLGRVTIVPYYPLSDEVMRTIIELKLKKVADRIAENYAATLAYEPRAGRRRSPRAAPRSTRAPATSTTS